MGWKRTVRGGLAGLALFVAQSGIASAQTGSIAGSVRDATGAVLPGVTVEARSPALIEGLRSASTDGQGLYKITDLRPGLYTVTFVLTGFSTVVREGLELSAGFTATVNAEMRLGSVAETITVSGQSPLVDVQNVVQQRVMTRDIIDTLPTGKSFQSYAVLIPGVMVAGAGSALNGQDVGGAVGEKQVYLSVHGSRGLEMPLIYDGMRYNNMNGYGGGYNSVWMVNTGNVEEITVETGAASAEADVAGVRSNIIPKSGGNTFRGYFLANFTNRSLQADNISEDLTARGASPGAATDKAWDLNPAYGGPLRRDRLWFYTAFRHWGINEAPVGAFYDRDPLDFVYEPDPSRPAINETWNRSSNIRFTWQATPRNKLALYFDSQQRCTCHWNLSSTRSPEASVLLETEPNYVLQATWSAPVTNRLLFDAGATLYPGSWTQLPVKDAPPSNVLSVNDTGRGTTFRAAPSHLLQRNVQYSSKFSASYVTGTHAFKVGMQTQNGYRNQTNWVNGDMRLTLRNGVPTSITVLTTQYQTEDRLRQNISFYGQDQWKARNLTLSLGLRYDYINAYVPEQHLGPVRFVGARDFAEVPDVPNWTDVSPRLGVSYDLFDNGRTALKFSWGRYLQGITTLIAGQVNPINTSVNTGTRAWTDLNSDFFPQESELGPYSPSTFGQLNITSRYDDDLTNGFGKRGVNWETSAGIQHEIRPGLSATVSYNRRSYGNFTATDNLLVMPSDYSAYCVPTPSDPRLPGGGGHEICGLYDISPAKFGLVDNLVTFADRFGRQTDVYNGVDAAVNLRLPRGVLLQGGSSTGQQVTDNCFVVDSPQALRFCHVKPPFTTQLKFLGVYPLPWSFIASGTFQSIPGITIAANAAIPNALIAPSLGRNLAACGALTGCTQTATVALIEPGTMFGDRLNQLDARVTRRFNVDRFRIQAQFDIYNLLNANPVLAMNTTFGANWQQPTVVLPGRLFKFGVQLDF
jgi:outer membrane receptor protein involved in Fe transport